MRRQWKFLLNSYKFHLFISHLVFLSAILRWIIWPRSCSCWYMYSNAVTQPFLMKILDGRSTGNFYYSSSVCLRCVTRERDIWTGKTIPPLYSARLWLSQIKVWFKRQRANTYARYEENWLKYGDNTITAFPARFPIPVTYYLLKSIGRRRSSFRCTSVRTYI